MIVTLDIGNSAISLCCAEDGRRLARFALSSDKERTADEYAVLMEVMAAREGLRLRDAAGAIAASVVPALTPVLRSAVEKATGRRALLVGPGVKSGLNIRMDDPAELGGDLVAAAVAALERYALPCVFVDMGAATAVGVLDGKGNYVGGLICPGVAMSLRSLTRDASQLSDIILGSPRGVIGRNTRDSMVSGLIYGNAAMLDGIIDRVEDALESPVSVVLTGEGAREIVRYCRREGMVVNEDLVMQGLCSIYARNRDSGKGETKSVTGGASN